jgi:hypothetical protein
MSDLESLVKLFESRGFTGKEAIEKAEANRNRDVELEKIKLEQIKQSGINNGELCVDPSLCLSQVTISP